MSKEACSQRSHGALSTDDLCRVLRRQIGALELLGNVEIRIPHNSLPVIIGPSSPAKRLHFALDNDFHVHVALARVEPSPT